MTNWIPTEPNPDGSLTIKGKTYSDDTEHEIYEGYVLKNDENHFGEIFFTHEMAKKYGLEAELMDDYQLKEWIERGGDRRYKYKLVVHHYWGTINGDGKVIDSKTPWGDCKSQELFCHMENLSLEFFNEDEKDVLIWGWCDG